MVLEGQFQSSSDVMEAPSFVTLGLGSFILSERAVRHPYDKKCSCLFVRRWWFATVRSSCQRSMDAAIDYHTVRVSPLSLSQANDASRHRHRATHSEER